MPISKFAPVLPRRQFLQRSLATAAIAATGPWILRGQSLNEKLNIGFIGAGGKAVDNLKGLENENVAALCDVDETSLDKAAQKLPAAKKYRDYRRLLEQKDLDAVVVTTPDHFHAVASIAAMKLGKHVYCEKPLTHSIFEAREMKRVAREYKVATQMGNSGHSSETPRLLIEWLQAGAIGTVKEVHAWSDRPIWPQANTRPAATPPVPSSLDWDLWLGPAPFRPYHPAYHPFKWRGWWDFGTGALGDMGCHIIDAAFWALDLKAPSAIEAESEPVNEESPPISSVVKYEFEAREGKPPVRLTWYDGKRLPGRDLSGLAEKEKLPTNGSLFVGDKGTVLVGHGTGLRLTSGPNKDSFSPPEKSLPRSAGHYKDWVAACKGGAPAGSNFEYAAGLTELVLLGNVALRVGHRIEWDAEAMAVKNAPEATRFIKREYRQGWSL